MILEDKNTYKLVQMHDAHMCLLQAHKCTLILLKKSCRTPSVLASSLILTICATDGY